MVLHGAWIDRWKSRCWAGDLEPRNLGRRKGEFGYDTMSSTTWIPERTITVQGRWSSVFKDYAHRDLWQSVISSTYGTLRSYRIFSLSASRTSEFLCKVGTRQKRKIGTVIVFPFVGFCNFAFLPHASC